jgi:RPA family protein
VTPSEENWNNCVFSNIITYSNKKSRVKETTENIQNYIDGKWLSKWSVDHLTSKGERIKKFPETNENYNSFLDSFWHNDNTKILCF